MDANLLRIARRVVWWQSPEETLSRVDDFLCRVMARATLEDANYVEGAYGTDRFKAALASAPPGVMDARSWHYWHARLGLGVAGPLPVRAFA